MKRIAVIGAGRWAHMMHQPALVQAQIKSTLTVCGVCDLDKNARESFAKPFVDARCYHDANKMVEELKPDGVVLLLRPDLLPKFIEFAIKLQLPFLCEKPPAANIVQHQYLIDIVRDMPHLVGYNRRFSPYIQKAKEWIGEENLTLVHSSFARFRRTHEDFSTTFVHGVDTTLFLLNEPLIKLNACIDYHDGYYNLYLDGKTKSNARVQCEILPNVGSSLEHYEIKSENVCVEVAFAQSNMVDLPGFVEKHSDNQIAEHYSHYDFGMKAKDIFHLGGFVDEYKQFSALLRQEGAFDSTLRSTFLTQLIRDQIVQAVLNKQQEISIDISAK